MNRPLLWYIFASLAITSVNAGGLNRNGVGAIAMGKGGAAVTALDDPFAGMAVNPALLSYLSESDFSASFVGIVADAGYSHPQSGNGYLDADSGVFPEFVFRRPIGDKAGLGFSLIPEQARSADWVYRDAPGGIDGSTSYGLRHHRSEIVGVRSALGLGVQLSDSLSVGASVGLLYNRNGLNSPYLFQSHPVLAGFKTLLDMETEGYGVNGDLGMLWQARENLSFGLAYRTPTTVKTQGSAKGDIGAQLSSVGLNGVPSTFEYDAEIVNHFPDQVTFGSALRISDRTEISLEADWVRWGAAFDDLEVSLTGGSNPAINDLLGSDSIRDTIPLEWRDVIVYRFGVEHRLTEQVSLRAGYSYGRNPVPLATLSPMTAAISEHALSAGVTWKGERNEVSLAYAQDLPISTDVNATGLRASEYLGGKLDLMTHWLALTVKHEF